MWARYKFSFDLHSLSYFPCPVKLFVFLKPGTTILSSINHFLLPHKKFFFLAHFQSLLHLSITTLCLTTMPVYLLVIVYKVSDDMHCFIDIYTEYLNIWLKKSGCSIWSNWYWPNGCGTDLRRESENCNGLANNGKIQSHCGKDNLCRHMVFKYCLSSLYGFRSYHLGERLFVLVRSVYAPFKSSLQETKMTKIFASCPWKTVKEMQL